MPLCIPPELNARLRAQILGDPEGREIFQALDSVSNELSSLPPLTMPAHYAARLDAAIAHESSARVAALNTAPNNVRQLTLAPPPPGQPPAPAVPVPRPAAERGNVVSLDAARSRRRGVLAGLGIAAAVAAVAAVTITLVQSNHPSGQTAGSPQPGPSVVATTSTGAQSPGNGGGHSTAALRDVTVDPHNPQAAFDQVNGKSSGDLSDPLAAASCFAELKLSGPQVLGVSNADYQGQPAYAIAVAVAGDPSRARLLVVADGCGRPGATPSILLERTVER